jgi:ribosomal protein S18 acetylase RimI-like enzyme
MQMRMSCNRDGSPSVPLRRRVLPKPFGPVTALPMELRPYAPGDEDAIAELWFESWRSVGLEKPVVTKAEMAERVPRELAGRWTVTVVEEAGELLGFLALAVAERRLDQLFVAPEAQGRGIGKALFEIAREQMPDGFWLSTQPGNARARAFYERHGMTLERVELGAQGDRLIYTLG